MPCELMLSNGDLCGLEWSGCIADLRWLERGGSDKGCSQCRLRSDTDGSGCS